MFNDHFMKIANKHAPYQWSTCQDSNAVWVTGQLISYNDEPKFRTSRYMDDDDAIMRA